MTDFLQLPASQSSNLQFNLNNILKTDDSAIQTPRENTIKRNVKLKEDLYCPTTVEEKQVVNTLGKSTIDGDTLVLQSGVKNRLGGLTSFPLSAIREDFGQQEYILNQSYVQLEMLYKNIVNNMIQPTKSVVKQSMGFIKNEVDNTQSENPIPQIVMRSPIGFVRSDKINVQHSFLEEIMDYLQKSYTNMPIEDVRRLVILDLSLPEGRANIKLCKAIFGGVNGAEIAKQVEKGLETLMPEFAHNQQSFNTVSLQHLSAYSLRGTISEHQAIFNNTLAQVGKAPPIEVQTSKPSIEQIRSLQNNRLYVLSTHPDPKIEARYDEKLVSLLQGAVYPDTIIQTPNKPKEH
ncbi:MAG: hypothetical protein H2174_10320 [Vampirovibrio sp.]|nr:hypothetical protein [Vampirovibrio sp.]